VSDLDDGEGEEGTLSEKREEGAESEKRVVESEKVDETRIGSCRE
jgi:hypothetical protein